MSLLAMLLALACKPEVLPPAQPPPAGSNKGVVLITDQFQQEELLVVGSASANFIVSFFNEYPDGSKGQFRAVQRALPVILADSLGNRWDIFGLAVQGPLKGSRLKSTLGYMGFAFAWGAMYPGFEIYEGPAPAADLPQESPTHDWAIPRDWVFAATGRDVIASLELPAFENFQERNYIDRPFYVGEEELVAGVMLNGQLRLYPHAILNWHEVANDTLGEVPFSLIYCPLTGTATAWERSLKGSNTTFGVSGLLYNNNVVVYDRLTESYWSQMKAQCVFGELIHQQARQFHVVEASWKTWQLMYYQPQVLSENTGYNRDYTRYPYGDYRTNNEFLGYPLLYDDPRLPRKERVHGIVINGKARIYRFDSF